jgi:HSP20 family protein
MNEMTTTKPQTTAASQQVATKSSNCHQPFSLVQKLQHEINKVFEDFGHGFGVWKGPDKSTAAECLTKIDVKDCGDVLVVTAEVPGVEIGDLQITSTPHYLSIAGEKKSEKEGNEAGYYHMERQYGFFRRVIPMPSEIKEDKVDATFKNGVLTVTLPKTKAAIAAEQQISVRVG